MLKRFCAVVLGTLTVAAAATAVGTPSLEESAQEIGFNHFWAVVDTETAKAVAENPFLRRFAGFEVRTTTANSGDTWTGRYIYGRKTYFELFSAGDRIMRGRITPEGAIGIALGGDRVGDLTRLDERLKQQGVTTRLMTRTRHMAGREVPWFLALMPWGSPPPAGSRASIWAMEYLPSYFDVPEAGKEAAEGPHDTVSRERYQSDVYRERLMRDLTRVDFAITAADYERLKPMFSAAGFLVKSARGRVLLDGPDVDLGFEVVQPQRAGLLQVHFELNGPAKAHSERVGRSVLKVGPGPTATWTFD